jgi:tetratricopeptide (TPR) repeat protein
MGDYYVRQSQTISDTVMKKADLEQAVVHFTIAVNVSRYFEAQTKLTSLLSLGDINTQLGYYAEAISNYQDAIDLNPKSTDVWKMEATIARLYVQLGNKTNALIRANDALAVAPTGQQNGIKALIDQINKLP